MTTHEVIDKARRRYEETKDDVKEKVKEAEGKAVETLDDFKDYYDEDL
ncbi:MAG: hypothetical protein WCO52_04605 [bacterium]